MVRLVSKKVLSFEFQVPSFKIQVEGFEFGDIASYDLYLLPFIPALQRYCIKPLNIRLISVASEVSSSNTAFEM